MDLRAFIKPLDFTSFIASPKDLEYHLLPFHPYLQNLVAYHPFLQNLVAYHPFHPILQNQEVSLKLQFQLPIQD